tara:strand:- start:603 stop:983 length:381 start_codon:yes stop_codon:yes gene_type:complete
MKKLLLFCFLLFACSDDYDKLFEIKPSLIVVNKDSEYPVIEIKLEGYEFKGFKIAKGSSRTFQLSDGISDLVNVNINIKIDCSADGSSDLIKSKIVDFSDGNPTITIKDNKPNDSNPMNCDNAVVE